jgi:hypothetical protein
VTLRVGTACCALVLAGCGGDEPSPAPTPVVRTPVISDTESATCEQVGGTKRYPAAALANTFEAATVLGREYAEKFEQEVLPTAQAFATQILADCDKADDPDYEPVPPIRARAEAAERGASILTALKP